MQTYQTIEDAQEAATSSIYVIAEIDHAVEGRCYILCRCSVEGLVKALAAKPMPEIIRVVRGHEIVRKPAAPLTGRGKCERCARVIDLSTAYHQPERVRWQGTVVTMETYYCEGCRSLLSMIGQGEYTELQDRARL